MAVLANLAATIEPAGAMRTRSPTVEREGGHHADRAKKQPEHGPGNRRLPGMPDDARRDTGTEPDPRRTKPT